MTLHLYYVDKIKFLAVRHTSSSNISSTNLKHFMDILQKCCRYFTDILAPNFNNIRSLYYCHFPSPLPAIEDDRINRIKNKKCVCI